MKRKRIFAFLLALACIISSLSGISVAKADSGSGNLMIDRKFNRVIEAEAGSTVHVKVPFMALNNYVYNPIIVTTYGDNAPFTTSNVSMTQNDQEATLISGSNYTYIEFDLYVKDTAQIGNYDLGIQFTYDLISEMVEKATETHSLSVRVSKEKDPTQIALNNISYNQDSAAIGNTFDLSFDVSNEGEIEALNTYLVVDYGDTGIVPGYSVENIKVGNLKAGGKQKVTLSMKVLPTAKEGFATLTGKFTYKDGDGKSYTDTKNLYVTIKEVSIASKEDASLVISNASLNEEVLAGSEFWLKGTLENIGQKKASKIKVIIADGTGVETGIIANYKSDGISVADIAVGKSNSYSVPVLVSKTAAAGLRELSLQVTYDDSQGKSHTIVSKYYLTVVQADAEETKSEVVISNVSQSPSAPSAGDIVYVSFTLENKSTKAVTDVSVGGKELSSNGFEPVSAEPDVKVGTIEAGGKKNITLQFKVGTGIAEGLNPLKLGCTYKDSAGKVQSQDSTVYILHVQNNSNSKPKLIVSDFSTDSEEQRAGKEFNFTFDLKNTHSTKSAKNIKVTLSQADNVFSASQGSNSFYIEHIKPGETVSSTVPMKVKNDAATGAYELKISVEYEYDDMSKMDEEAGGVKEDNVIKLQAVENARPVIENISIGSWDTPTVNQSTAMSFEFYNMGKSTLNNVYFTFEGDFKLETGQMFYLGSVTAGYSEYVEPSIIPLIEGMAKGTIVIHFEDSNGDEITVEKEIPETYIQGEMIFDDPGNWGGDMPTMNDGVATANKNIVPLWLFIVIQLGILIVFIPVVRIVAIRVHKHKLMKAEDRI